MPDYTGRDFDGIYDEQLAKIGLGAPPDRLIRAVSQRAVHIKVPEIEVGCSIASTE